MTIPLSYWPGGSFSFFADVYLKTLVVFGFSARRSTTSPPASTVVDLSLLTCRSPDRARELPRGTFSPAPGPTIEADRRYAAPLTGNPNDLALL